MLDIVLINEVRHIGRSVVRSITSTIDRAVNKELNFFLQRLVNEGLALLLFERTISDGNLDSFSTEEEGHRVNNRDTRT